MKTIQLVLLFSAIAIVIALLVLLPNNNQVFSAQRGAPTLAPLPTEGPIPPLPDAPWKLLSQPLTPEQALARAVEVDKTMANWDEPWSEITLKTQPDRVSVVWHSDRSYDGDEYGPGAEMGPVWVITIKGPVRITERTSTVRFHDGITYTIAQNTGNLLRFTAGPWVEK